MNTITVYCPRDCNVASATEEYPYNECASCGSLMTADSLDDFDSVHDMIAERQISEENTLAIK
jgi:hypothetical protein